MNSVQKFDEWMFKLRNKYYFDNERMNNAYNRIIEKTNEQINF